MIINSIVLKQMRILQTGSFTSHVLVVTVRIVCSENRKHLRVFKATSTPEHRKRALPYSTVFLSHSVGTGNYLHKKPDGRSPVFDSFYA